MVAWNPTQYLKFAGQRMQPALDLLARVPLERPATVFDLGCGAGNITRILAERWPDATVTGIDSSTDMLAKAQAEPGAITWIQGDLEHWAPSAPADLLYSNAALHWLDDHHAAFARFAGLLAPGGVLAVQMPRNHAEPSHACMVEAAEAGPWRERLAPVLRPSPVAAPAVYHDILAPLASHLDLWETIYYHPLEGDNPVLEWTRGSALKPLLDALEGMEREGFLADYSARIAAAYPKRADGITLFPFRRLFMVAVR